MITSISQLDLNKKYTYADYLTWQFDEMVELENGVIIRRIPVPMRWHQEYLGNIFFKFHTYFKNKTSEIYKYPFDVRLIKNKENGQIETVVQPDICVICDLDKLDELGCIGSPDLIVEVVSKSSKKRDYHDKYDLYEENGVLEYWIVDPDAKSVDVFVLEDEKYIQKGGYFNEADVIPCTLFPEFQVSWKEIFAE
jgi:Uma2 family endonuclease